MTKAEVLLDGESDQRVAMDFAVHRIDSMCEAAMLN